LLDRIEEFVATLDAKQRQQPDVAQALDRIAHDTEARDRYLAFARDADELDSRARMIDVAQDLGWLSADQRRTEIVAMLGTLLARKQLAEPDVNVASALHDKHD